MKNLEVALRWSRPPLPSGTDRAKEGGAPDDAPGEPNARARFRVDEELSPPGWWSAASPPGERAAAAAPPAEDVAAMLEEAHRERARMLQQIGDAMGGL